MNIHNNYSLAICTKNFIIFCAKFLLTRKIIYAILEPQRKTNERANKPERKIDMIELAIAYAAAHGNTEEAKNDAANIYSRNYEEYMEIWIAIKDL